MTLPVSQTTIATLYNQLQDAGNNTKSYALQLQSEIAANAVSATDVLALLSSAVNLLALAETIAGNSATAASMVSYAALMTGVDTFTAGSLTASMTALGALIAAIATDYPKDTAGHLLDRIFSASGAVTWVPLTAASLPTTAAALTAWLDTIS
jgi:hypothetical protein